MTQVPKRKTRANAGQTSLKRRPRATDPMREFDGLPQELRSWVARADLPWRPGSGFWITAKRFRDCFIR